MNESLSDFMEQLSFIKEEVSEKQRVVDDLTLAMRDLERTIMSIMLALGLDSVQVKDLIAAPAIKKHPVAKDWDAVYRYVVSTNSPHLFQKRLNSTAIRELWEDGIVIPGIEEFEETILKIRKARR